MSSDSAVGAAMSGDRAGGGTVDADSTEAAGDDDRHPLFLPLVLLGGFVFGAGLAVSRMARPEVVLDFLQFEDFGLLFVMGGAALVVGPILHLATRSGERAPLTERVYGLRRKTMDSNVLLGGVVFGVGWGISGICPGAAYASVGIGNWPILAGIAGMFVGAYGQGVARDVVDDAGD